MAAIGLILKMLKLGVCNISLSDCRNIIAQVMMRMRGLLMSTTKKTLSHSSVLEVKAL